MGRRQACWGRPEAGSRRLLWAARAHPSLLPTHTCAPERPEQTQSLTYAPALASLQAGLMDADGHLVGESDGQGFGLGVASYSSKPGKKTKSRRTLKEQLR